MSEIILFDLDGTLTDSGEGITKSVQYALQHFGIEEPDLKKLECFVGPPLKEQFMKYCRFSEKQAEVAVSVYRERYAKVGIFENHPYAGIESVLKLLQSKGKTLGVASSKPTIYVRRILEHFKLDQYFEVVVGAELDGTRTDKSEVIERAIELLGMQEHRTNILMVGDRHYDVEGALQCGLQCVGVAYGYGGIYELETAGAVYIAQTVEDLKILTGITRRTPKETQTKKHTPEFKKQQHLVQKVLDVLYPFGMYYVVTFVVNLLARGIIMIWFHTMYGTNAGGGASYLEAFSMIISGISSVALIGVAGWIYRRECKRRNYGISAPGKKKNRRFGVSGYIAGIILMICASQLVNDLITYSKLDQLFPYYSTEISQEIYAKQSLWVMIIAVVILAPIAEELIFRGLIFKRMNDYMSAVWAILLSSVLFGVFHENMVQFVYASILGLLFGLLMHTSGSVKMAIAGHMAANAWSVLGPRVIYQLIGDDQKRYLLLQIGFLCFGILALGYVIIRNKMKVSA